MESDFTKEQARDIFEKHSSNVFRTALGLTKSKMLAEDIMQETFLLVFRNFHSYDSSQPIEPWIYKIAVNVTRNMLRKQKWLRFFEKTPELDVDSSDSVEQEFLKSEAEKALWNEINVLPIKSKEIIFLHFYAGLTLTEVSHTLEVPIGTCKSRLHTALNKLRKQLPKNPVFETYEKGVSHCEPI